MTTRDEVRDALYARIMELAKTQSIANIKELAEAWAWLAAPGQPHG